MQRIAGEIKSFSTDGLVAPKLSKRMDRFMLYMLTAGKKALADGGVTEDVMQELDKKKCGVLIGSAMGGMKVNLNYCLHVKKKGSWGKLINRQTNALVLHSSAFAAINVIVSKLCCYPVFLFLHYLTWSFPLRLHSRTICQLVIFQTKVRIA